MLNINIGIHLLLSIFIISFFITPTSIYGQAAQNNETLDNEAVINITKAVNNLASNISASNAASTNNTDANKTAANTSAVVIGSIFERHYPVYFLLVIAGAMVLPLLFDMFYAYRKKPKESIDKEGRGPVGMQGLYRTLMTFGIILLVGTVIFYVLALITLNINNPTNSAALQSLIDVLKNLSTILGTALATIIAFYFGMRGAESATKGAAAAAKVPTETTTTTAPTIVSTNPVEAQKGVAIDSNVVANFSKQMNGSTIKSSTFTLKKNGDPSNIPGEVTLAPDGKTATLNPSSNLELNTKYTATITKEVKDVAGNPIASDKTWSFTTTGIKAPTETTTTAPTIVSTNPVEAQKGVAIDSNVVANFSKQMNGSTIKSSTFTLKKNGDPSNIPGEVTLAPDGKTATLNPSSNLELNTKYTATITKEVKDVAGNPIASDKTWSFDTA